MKTNYDDNNGLGYSLKYAEFNAGRWRVVCPNSLVTVVERGKGRGRWMIVIDVVR